MPGTMMMRPFISLKGPFSGRQSLKYNSESPATHTPWEAWMHYTYLAHSRNCAMALGVDFTLRAVMRWKSRLGRGKACLALRLDVFSPGDRRGRVTRVRRREGIALSPAVYGIIGIAMWEKLADIERRYEELERLMADPAVVADYNQLKVYAQERAELEPIVETYRALRGVDADLAETRALLEEETQPEMRELAQEEIDRLEARREVLQQELRRLLLPKDPRDERNVIVEIRAGEGGEEAALFAADLFRMYTRYAENHGWEVELLSANETGIGGFKEVIFEVKGRGAYSRLKYESGVHRVQRIPITEAGGRIHTSTATVAVLPEPDEVEVKLNPDDLHFDYYRSSGAGGQNVQKNATAVRVTHIPTGLVVACQDERSQVQNRLRALSILRARLFALEQQKQFEEIDSARRSQVGRGERAEKIRTYNFPQNRVTDHRIGLTSYRLESILNGELDEFIDALATQEQVEKLQAAIE